MADRLDGQTAETLVRVFTTLALSQSPNGYVMEPALEFDPQPNGEVTISVAFHHMLDQDREIGRIRVTTLPAGHQLDVTPRVLLDAAWDARAQWLACHAPAN